MATDFLWAQGTNGLITSLLTVMTTELNALTIGNTATSTVGGASGVFSQSNTAQAQWAEMFLTLGAIGSATSANSPNVSGWFLTTPNGSTFETPGAGNAPPRPPDFTIPVVSGATIAGGSLYKAVGLILVPALNFKVLIQNNIGQNFAATANTLTIAAIASQY